MTPYMLTAAVVGAEKHIKTTRRVIIFRVAFLASIHVNVTGYRYM